jgi:hypothetical protein
VAGKLDLVEGEAALAAPEAKVAGAGEGATVVFGVVGCVERSAGVGLETLETVPLGSFVSLWAPSCVGGRWNLQSRSGERGGYR